MAKPDLNKLKAEIDNRKRERNLSPSILGEQLSEQVGAGISPRDTFLYGLIESLKRGKETASTNLIKTVDTKAALKKGETPKLQINEAPVQRQLPQQRITEVDMSPERDEQMFADIEKNRKQTLVETIEQYGKIPRIGTPMTNAPQSGSMQLNEGYLVENVKKIVNNYLVENFGPVIEEAIKSTVIEMYAVERIKEVLHENKELVKSIVYETIRELQAKNKAKAQS
jgi:hypothetical protein